MNVDGVSAILISIHTGISALTKNPVWNMEASEADALAKAATNVAKHYPMLNGHEKLADWAMLLQALAVSYGTRFYLSMPDKPKPKPPQNGNANYAAPYPNVSQFPG